MRLTQVAMTALLAVVAAGSFPVRPLFAQEPPSRLPPPVPRLAYNSVFVEAGGPGILYSLNYDRMLSEMFSVRAGGTYIRFHELHDDGAAHLLVPIVGNFLLGSQNHKFEVGLGVVPGWAFGFHRGDDAGFQFNEVALAGYRYAPSRGGISFRANVEAIHLKAGILPWAGASVGRDF